MKIGHVPCCFRNEWYSVRRYAPNGVTLWTRDYYRDAVLFDAGSGTAFELHVAVLNDLIYVAGPRCEDAKGHQWSLVCYTARGDRLWRKSVEAQWIAQPVRDIVAFEGALFVVSASPQTPGFPTPFSQIVRLDADGEPIRVEYTTEALMLAPLTVSTVNVDLSGGGFPFSRGPGKAVGIDGLCFYLAGVPSHRSGYQRILSTAFNAAGQMACGGHHEPEGAGYGPSVSLSNPTYNGILWSRYLNSDDRFPAYARVPALAFSENGDLLSVGSQFWNGDDAGSIIRWDSSGNRIWTAGLGERTCLSIVPSEGDAADPHSIWIGGLDRGVLVRGVATGPNPTVAKYLPNGERLWGHRHFNAQDVGLLSDGTAVYVGTRHRRGLDEQDFVE